GVFITGSKLKALLNPQPSWGFSGHKKMPTKLSAWCESIVLCSNSKKEVRQYGAQRPSLDVAFTCGNDSAAQQGKKC
ncbi:hypothetical protein, partial [Pectobacterium polaris]|uniref:hypothetical protein n=1 Tax=Pectobacterium polaris TaxID=2042057 RepID=UPI0024075A3B